MSPVDDHLMHYGVPGMKWGKHKAKDSGSASKKRSRKEVRTLNREGRREFDQARANKLISEATKKGDGVLMKITTPNSPYPTIATGREFIDHLAAGGAFDVRTTDIYARKDSKTQTYVLNETPTERYQKVKR